MGRGTVSSLRQIPLFYFPIFLEAVNAKVSLNETEIKGKYELTYQNTMHHLLCVQVVSI